MREDLRVYESEETRGVVAMRIIVSAITALLMAVIGLFWMFIWLVGTNGYSESKGGTILASNLVLVLLSIIGSAIASGWLARQMNKSTGWSAWVVAPLTIVGVVITSVLVLAGASLLVVAAVGTTR